MPFADKMLGGVGQIVEIDESVMINRKYHLSDLPQQHDQWVFGLYDRETKKGWIYVVPQQDKATFLPIIQQFIRPGSMVYSDGWAAYNIVANHGYVHRCVIHQDNFVDPVTGVHTQGMESYWSMVKQKIKAVYGSRLHLVPSYLDEFMWRERFGHNTGEAVENILQHIAEQY